MGQEHRHAPGLDLLLATARPRADNGDAALRTLVLAVSDWTPLIEAALQHGTAGLLSERLLADAADLLPADLLHALQAYRTHCLDRDAAAVGLLRELLDALAADGVVALPFKGPALARVAYANPGLRLCADLDLLIAERDIEPALASLAGLGFMSQYPNLRPALRRAYHRYNGQDLLLAPGRMPVEPHWSLAPRCFAARLDTGPLFGRARPVRLDGRDVLTLAPEDALLVACLHAGKEEWGRLVWIADVAGILARHPDLDASAVLARATAAGLHRALLIGVALARDLLGAPCPPPFATALAADRSALRLARHAAQHLWRRTPAASVFTFTAFRWRQRERLLDRLRYAAGTLLAARVPHYAALYLPDVLHGLYPLVRLGHDFVALPLWRIYRRITAA